MSPDPGAPLPPALRGPSLRPGPDFARRIPDDLGPIFATLPAVQAAPRHAPARIVRPSRQRRSLRAASLGALVAASLAGLSAGALVGRPADLFGRHAAAPPAPTPTLTAIAALDAPSGEAPIRLSPAPAPAAQVEVSAPRIEASAPAPAPARARPAAPRVQKARFAGHRRRGDVMAADRELRRAYARAIRAGAPHHVLVATRDQWDELRHEASYRPQAAAAGYWRLSARLDKVSDRAGSGGSAPAPFRRRHGLFHLW